MDIVCTRCGEPWDMSYVLHEEPEGFDRTGGLIHACPVCRGKPEPRLTSRERTRLANIAEIASLLGDDIDALVVALEDFDLL